jgi:sugar phosphate isomerase/epimerase
VDINFHKSFWEAQCNNEKELHVLLEKVKQEGYQGTELFLPFYPIEVETSLSAHKDYGLSIITGIATEGRDAQEHLESLKRQLDNAVAFSPKLINCHTGRDIFSFADNIMLFEAALQLEQEYDIKITHETHRTRPTFSTFGTEQIIHELPDLKLNLDISHWMVVHESDLSDQQARLTTLFENVHHVHARVGFEEGPQVTAPQDPRWSEQLNNHTQLWQQVVKIALERKEQRLTITPEFGPFPYAHIDPMTDQPITDIWAANNFIKQHLQENLTWT